MKRVKSNMTSKLARVAHKIENLFDSLKSEDGDNTPIVDPYIGYSTSTHLVARGRVLAFKEQGEVDDDEIPSTWENFRTMVALFASNEMEGVELKAGPAVSVSDEEGYFQLDIPRTGNEAAGWHDIPAKLTGYDEVAVLPILVTDNDADFGVISDIDDTMMQTDAWSLKRNLWTTMTGNSASRHVFPDAVQLMQRLHNGKNPVYYVSSSPWNMHAFLSEVFQRNGLVRGPKFLRDLGISPTQFIKGTHGDHKGAAIDTVLAANTGIPFILIGDTGQHDPHVYYDAIMRHPGRIKRAIFRIAGPELDAENEKWIAEIEKTGVPVEAVQSYAELSDA